MELISTRRIELLGSGSALPGGPIPSSVIESRFGRPIGSIERAMGVRTRYWSFDLDRGGVRSGCLNSELAAKAAGEALAAAKMKPGDIDLLVAATASSDMALPGNAPLIQDLLHIENCAAIDLRSACTGFLQGIFVAASALQAGTAEVACVVASETTSLLLNLDLPVEQSSRSDFVNAALFGDGAGAVILKATSKASFQNLQLRQIRVGSVGLGQSPGIWIEGSGTASRTADEQRVSDRPRLRQDYQRVLMSGQNLYVRGTQEVCGLEGIGIEDITLGIPHQANGRVKKIAERTFGDLAERFYFNIDRVGNCGAASIPIAFDEVLRSRSFSADDYVLLSAGEASKWLYGAALFAA